MIRCGTEGPAFLPGTAALLFGRRLDLNAADAAALEVLPGIGPARAQAIEASRKRAPFCRVEDLERIWGIGPGIVRGLSSWLRATHPACPQAQPGVGDP